MHIWEHLPQTHPSQLPFSGKKPSGDADSRKSSGSSVSGALGLQELLGTGPRTPEALPLTDSPPGQEPAGSGCSPRSLPCAGLRGGA